MAQAELLVAIHSLNSSSPKSLHQITHSPACLSKEQDTCYSTHQLCSTGSHLSPSGISPILHVTRKLPHISYFRCTTGNQYTLQNVQKILQPMFLKLRILSQIAEEFKSSSSPKHWHSQSEHHYSFSRVRISSPKCHMGNGLTTPCKSCPLPTPMCPQQFSLYLSTENTFCYDSVILLFSAYP